MLGLGLSLVATLAAQAPQAAQPAETPGPSTTVSGVTVLGPKLKQVPNFVAKLAQATSEGQVPRWYGEICPRTLGGPPEINAYFNRRIIEIARSVGVRAGTPKCNVDVTVFLTDDPDRFTRRAERKASWLFYNPYAKWPVDLSKLKRFVETPRPVRWWHVVQTGDPDSALAGTANAAGISGGLSDFGAPVTSNYGGGSRVKPPVIDEIQGTVLVVDTRAIWGFKAGAVTAYLAMVLLADPESDEDFSSMPTIMNLFANAKQGRAWPNDLTHWDRSYLRSLYKIPAGSTANTERSAITAQMAQELKDDDSADAVLPAQK